MKKKHNKKKHVKRYVRSTQEEGAAFVARQAGLFLVKSGSKWEFMSVATGQLMMIWYSDNLGCWTPTAGSVGKAVDTSQAVKMAARIIRMREPVSV